jgi:hypothetical protein
MKFYFNWILGATIILVIGGCRKIDLPDSSTAGIAFGVKGNLDGESLYIGLDSFDFEFTTESSNVMNLDVFQGGFNTFDDSNWKINFQIRNNQAGDFFDSSYWSMPRNLPYFFSGLSSITSQWPVEYELFSSSSSITEAITNIQPGNLEILGSKNTVNLTVGPNYTFCTEYKGNSGEGKFCCLLRPEASIPALGVDFGVSVISLNNTPLTATIYGDTSVEGAYKWSTGATGNTIIINGPGTYAVTFTDVDGNTVSHEKKIILNSANTGFQCGDVYPTMSLGPIIQAPNPDIFSTIEINLIDKDGKVYGSGNRQQPFSSDFEIEEVRFIEPDFFRLQRVMALKVKFSCQVISLDTEVKELTDFEGWIGVGID